MKKKQVVLVVLDGWGYREDEKDNAVLEANTPVFDKLWSEYPHTLLKASGEAVGLPEGQMGNSEVGHITIGAGTVVDTDLVRISKQIREGKFGENGVIKKLFDHVKKYDSVLHLQGLVSPGGVHSHQDHLYAVLREAKKAGVNKVAIHVFTDGRDTKPKGAHAYMQELEKIIEELGVGFIASMSGRFYAMDRDKHWERTKRAEDAIFECRGNVCQLKKPSAQLLDLYNDGITDEYIEPIVFADENGKTYGIEKNDAVFFFNFRADRARQLTERVIENTKHQNVCFATMTDYSATFACDVAFPDVIIKQTLGKVVSDAGLKQSHIAETEKFAHATYFLNCGRERPYEKEEQIIIPSRKDVKTHDEAPEMKAHEVADAVIKELERGQEFVFVNFANPDMVGHTGNVKATIKAVETADRELGRVIEVLDKVGGVAFITADHGNAEINKYPDGSMHTAHTTDPVPAIITCKDKKFRNDGGLSFVAPTIIELLNLQKPEEMKGESLLV